MTAPSTTQPAYVTRGQPYTRQRRLPRCPNGDALMTARDERNVCTATVLVVVVFHRKRSFMPMKSWVMPCKSKSSFMHNPRSPSRVTAVGVSSEVHDAVLNELCYSVSSGRRTSKAAPVWPRPHPAEDRRLSSRAPIFRVGVWKDFVVVVCTELS